MTPAKFKKDLNTELKNAGFPHQIKKVMETGANTTLIFDTQKAGLNMAVIKWLNNRFQYGISVTNTDHSLVFINTPLQGKVEID